MQTPQGIAQHHPDPKQQAAEGAAQQHGLDHEQQDGGRIVRAKDMEVEAHDEP
ncbi:hypothetical protein D3C72_2511340 [compost metagenome]